MSFTCPETISKKNRHFLFRLYVCPTYPRVHVVSKLYRVTVPPCAHGVAHHERSPPRFPFLHVHETCKITSKRFTNVPAFLPIFFNQTLSPTSLVNLHSTVVPERRSFQFDFRWVLRFFSSSWGKMWRRSPQWCVWRARLFSRCSFAWLLSVYAQRWVGRCTTVDF